MQLHVPRSGRVDLYQLKTRLHIVDRLEPNVKQPIGITEPQERQRQLVKRVGLVGVADGRLAGCVVGQQ